MGHSNVFLLIFIIVDVVAFDTADSQTLWMPSYSRFVLKRGKLRT